jgi:hypothetical protein
MEREEMKRIYIGVLLFFLMVSLYSQTIVFDAFLNPELTFKAINDSAIIDEKGELTNIIYPGGGMFKTTEVKSIFLGSHITPNKTWVIKIDEPGFDGFLSLDDVCTAKSHPLPNNILTKHNGLSGFYWIPYYTLDIVRSGYRDRIFDFEPGRPKGGFEMHSVSWHEIIPDPMLFEISNFWFSYSSPPMNHVEYLVKNIEDYTAFYKVTLLPYIDIPKNGFLMDYIYRHNFPYLDSGKPIILLFEAANNRMRIYNGESKRIVFDLVKVTPAFYDKYLEFIKTNIVPEDLIIPPELLEGWPGDIVISPPYAEGEKIFYITVSDTAFYDMPDESADLIAALPQGTKVFPLEPGLGGTINGVSGSWVWAETEAHEKGWCFSGYLEELAPSAPVSGQDIPETAHEAAAIPAGSALPSAGRRTGFSPVVIGGGAAGFLVIGLLVLLIRKKKHK